MKKKVLTLAIVLVLANVGTGTVYAKTTDYSSYNYQFSSGVDYKDELGAPTPTDVMGRDETTENIRRNKDTSVMPLPYGYFSGNIDTEKSNYYVTMEAQNYTRVTTDTTSSVIYDTTSSGINSLKTLNQIGYTSSYETLKTEPIEYANGSIGTLKISAIGVNVRVYEGETLTNMQKGVGHFSFTSAWDGNVGIAGHNGGSAGYFEDLKDLEEGDRIVYTTQYGTRTYKVTDIYKIKDTDFTPLGYSRENQLTLITCVRNSSTQRLVVIAKEV